MLRTVYFAFLAAMLAFAGACASQVPLDETESAAPARPAAAAPAAQANLPATAVETSISGKTPLGRLGLASEAPAGMCWLNMAPNSADAPLVALLVPSQEANSLQPLALAVSCEQTQAWRADRGKLPTAYLLIAQKMNERVGGGGANQARERWVMVQALGGNFGFFPQDQYTKYSYLTTEAGKLAPGGSRQLGEVRRDDMALYTVELKRLASGDAQLVLTQYSQLRGTPVALVWHKPLSRVESLSSQVLGASAYLAGLVRQSDDPRLAGQATAPAASVAPAVGAAPAAMPPHASAPAATQQFAGESVIGVAPVARAQNDITGWEKASFGMAPSELRQNYALANPLREDLHGRAFYLDGRNEVMAGLEFKVLFDFSDSPMGPQRLGRIIFTNTTSGGDINAQKSALLKVMSERYAAPTSDASASGGPIIWERVSGKASLQMMTSNNSAVWLIVLEAKRK